MIKSKFIQGGRPEVNGIKSRVGLAAGVAVALTMTSAPISAAQRDVDRLDEDLTPVGATQKGNEAGSIPSWNGGIIDPPSGYQPEGPYVHPYPNDIPEFVITRDNYKEYKGNLSAGQTAMFEQYPTFEMPVYRSRRSASFPNFVYEATRRNALRARLENEGESLLEAATGFPFPMPETGHEVIWNHKTRFRGEGIRRYNIQALVDQDGSYEKVGLLEKISLSYGNADVAPDELDNVLLYFEQRVVSPERLAGQVLKVYDTIDQVAEPRVAWFYNPGQRRLKRVPNIAYDNPGTATEGMRTTDQYDMFNGAMDRYKWKLVGKQEMYIPYNSYKLDDYSLRYDDIVRAKHLNTELTRYELHRVWVVDATRKFGTRHLYKRRVFYVDEDSWQIVAADIYDNRDNLWQVQEAHMVNGYDIKAVFTAAEVIYDLSAGRYIAMALDNEEEVIKSRYYVEESFN